MRALVPPGGLDDTSLAEAYRPPSGRFVRANFVHALDGATSVDGASAGLGSDADQRVFTVLRAWCDAVLVGHGTAAAEDYGPLEADSDVGRLRTELGRPATAPVVVVSRRASLSPGDRLAVPGTWLVTCAASDAERRTALTGAGVRVLVAGDEDVDLPAALDALAGEGIEHVLCEGGPSLFRDAVAAGVVDELCLTTAPLLTGGAHGVLGGEALPGPVRARLVQLLEEDGVLLARYALSRAA
ncbi:dihydrofolate reductase family protein [Klenkia brasiliensis]|uniref:Pyrimidine reductase, riboflavin biosynthesis n=1 Tax=Klenkia brasiliensis TaxID=333142 RepID=A0A1G7T5K3_9ACTN|nr:dihydrofolate reductase family protein [Klenkia brasiliensis]SDG29890.1 Pyrimidine reductase, riboflavin biosynthesis [Klenkia brasiliensis]